MTDQPPPSHGDLGPELRQLALTILDRVDPAVRSMAALAGARSGGEPGRCQQVWCPVCALAAVATGEEHPLLTVIAEHSVSLLAVVRSLVASFGADGDGPGTDPEVPDEPPRTNGRYQHIPIDIQD